MSGSLNAIVPMACVTAAGIAAMVAEAFRDPGERMPIGGLGVVGLLGAAFAATGVILSATYMLWMFQRVNYGPVTNEKNANLPDLKPREWAVIVPIIAVAILMGVLPNLFLRPIEPSVERMLNQFHRGASSRIQAHAVSKPSALSPKPFVAEPMR